MEKERCHMNPKVSIVLPNYNGGRYIKETILSVLNQTYKDFELIIVDDASTDESREIIESFLDERIIKHYSKVNRHVAYTTNIGFNMARGDYIARIDSDDQWEREKLEKQIEFMESNPKYGACFSKVNIIDEDGKMANDAHQWVADMFNNVENKTQKEWLQYFFFTGNCLCNPSALIRRKALDEIGKAYNLSYVPAQDFEMWTRLVVKYPIYIMNERLVKYRWTTEESKISGSTNGKEYAFLNVQMLVRKNFFDFMSNEEFVEFFGDHFLNSDSGTKLELEFEKAHLLEKCAGDNINFLGLEKYEELLRIPENLKLLEDKFDFSLKKFYQLYRVRNFGMMQDIQKYNLKINELQQELDQYKSNLANSERDLKNYVNELETLLNSTSWKVTQPLRKISSLIKKKN